MQYDGYQHWPALHPRKQPRSSHGCHSQPHEGARPQRQQEPVGLFQCKRLGQAWPEGPVGRRDGSSFHACDCHVLFACSLCRVRGVRHECREEFQGVAGSFAHCCQRRLRQGTKKVFTGRSTLKIHTNSLFQKKVSMVAQNVSARSENRARVRKTSAIMQIWTVKGQKHLKQPT